LLVKRPDLGFPFPSSFFAIDFILLLLGPSTSALPIDSQL